MSVRLRPATVDDLPFLRRMLYEAACWDPAVAHPPPEVVLADPHVAAYLEDWPGTHDAGLIAERGDTPLGACWYRFAAGHAPGYGYIDERTPELAIGVLAEERGRGTGQRLLEALIELARSRGVPALSLSVEQANPALRLYERCGFVGVGANGGAITMRLQLLGGTRDAPMVRPTARVILLDRSGRTLLFRARDPDDATGRPFWFPPGGGLEPGERHEDAARRELFEETGLRDVALEGPAWERSHTWAFGGQWYRSDERYLIARVDAATVSTSLCTDLEILAIAEHRWWTVEEIVRSADVFVPRQLPQLLPPVVRGELPRRVLRVE